MTIEMLSPEDSSEDLCENKAENEGERYSRVSSIIERPYLLVSGISGDMRDFGDTRCNSKVSGLKKTKNWFSFANILLGTFEIVPFALNTTICTIKKIIE